MTDPVLHDACALRSRMDRVARDLRLRRPVSPDDRVLTEFDARSCEAAVAMLAKLGTEVERLRLLILHNLDGRMSREDIRQAVTNWNGEPPEARDLGFGNLLG